VVNVFLDNVKAMLLRKCSKLDTLGLRLLINRGDTHVQSSTNHMIGSYLNRDPQRIDGFLYRLNLEVSEGFM
jgi:hypothetical protein